MPVKESLVLTASLRSKIYTNYRQVRPLIPVPISNYHVDCLAVLYRRQQINPTNEI